MNFTSDDINRQTDELNATVSFFEELGDDLGRASLIINNVIPQYYNIVQERKSLYRTLLAILLDTGQYSYTISDEVLNKYTEGYGLNVALDDETKSVTFSVIFPEQTNEENE